MFTVKSKRKCPTCVSKYKSTSKKQVILLINPNEKGWHYLAVTELPAFLREINLKNNGDFHCLNCLHTFSLNFSFILLSLNLMKYWVKVKIFVELFSHPKK